MSSILINSAFDQKYAPTNFADVVLSDPHAISQLNKYANGLTMRPLLLYGPYGTGKSTIAELLPFAMVHDFHSTECKWLIGDVRKDFAAKISAVENFASYTGLNSAGIRVIVIDEIDNMDLGLQRSLKGYLDKFLGHCFFIFTTNNIKNVDAGLRSRCERVHVGKAVPSDWLPRMRKILRSESVPIPSNQHLTTIAAASNGDCRELLRDLEDFVIRYRAKSKPPKPPKAKVTVLQGGKGKK